MDAVLFGVCLDVAPRVDAGEGHQSAMPGLRPPADDHPEVAALNVDAHRAERDAPGRCALAVGDLGLRGDHGFRVPVVAHLVVGGLGHVGYLSALLGPCQGEPLLFPDPTSVFTAVDVELFLRF